LFFQKKDTRKKLLLLTDVVEIWEETVNPFYYHSSIIIKYAKKCQRKYTATCNMFFNLLGVASVA
jgi:hypothetical protein